MAQGKDVSEYFPHVIKQTARKEFVTRKLTYTYLARYAETDPDVGLLAVNSIQSFLANSNAAIRATALRAMSSIRIPAIAGIIVLSIKECRRDMSSFVRRAAVQALGKCYDLDPSTGTQLLEHLEAFLHDKDPMVLGSALTVVYRYFPDRLDLLHTVFRRAGRCIKDFDEYSQVAALDLFTRYSRVYIRRPVRMKKGDASFYDSEKERAEETDATKPADVKYDADLRLLLEACHPLLYSRNSNVVLAASRALFYLGTRETVIEYGVPGALVRLMRGDHAIEYIALTNIREVCRAVPDPFVKYLTHFFVFPRDPHHVARLKLDVLVALCTDATFGGIFSELKYYASTRKDLLDDCMRAISQCALVVSEDGKHRILKWLLRQIRTRAGDVAGESLTAVRYLIQQHPEGHVHTIRILAHALDRDLSPKAKAAIIWIIGEYVPLAPTIGPDVLRKSIASFSTEDESVRYQLLVLAAKLQAYYGNKDEDEDAEVAQRVSKLYDHVVHLARYDTSYDTRDRCRMFASLLGSSLSKEIGTLILQAPKPLPGSDAKKTAGPTLLLGSSSLVLGYALGKFGNLPDWTDPSDLVDPSIRTEDTPVPTTTEVSRSLSSLTSLSHKDIKRTQPSVNGQTQAPRPLTTQTLDEFFADTPAAAEVEEFSSSDDYEEEDEEDDDEDEDEDDDDDEEEDDSEAESDSSLENEQAALIKQTEESE